MNCSSDEKGKPCFLKRLFKKLFRSKLFLKFKKGIRYLFRYGLRATLRKLRERRAARRKARRPRYTEKDYAAQRTHLFPKKITFSILVPLYNTPIRFLTEMIDSVTAQTYGNWELCLADGSDGAHGDVEDYCLSRAQEDSRIRYQKLAQNGGISENTNACIAMATGDFIALFDHDDILHPAALYEMMRAITEKNADFVYTDESVFESPDIKKITTLHFKPDFAPDTLRSNNYICHFSAFSREVLEKAGLFRKAFDGSQDHDMILRLTENASCVCHIPIPLYFWRSHPLSVAMDISSKTYAIEAGRNAVKESAMREGFSATVTSTRAFPTTYRVKYDIIPGQKVSLLLYAGKKPSDLSRCLSAILESPCAIPYEILIAGMDADLALPVIKEAGGAAVRLVENSAGLSFAKAINRAAKLAEGDTLVLMDSTVEIKEAETDWLSELIMFTQRERIGAAGPLMLYPNGSVYHAGLMLGMGEGHLVGLPFHRCHATNLGYMGRLCFVQNVSALSGACLAVKKALFDQVGGLDEAFTAFFADVDLCLKLGALGKHHVFSPHVQVVRHISPLPDAAYVPHKKCDRFKKDAVLFEKRYHAQIEKGDPYFNPNFSSDSGDFLIV